MRTTPFGLLLTLGLLLASPVLAETTPEPPAPKLLYTTYFYTAGEAIVHGYEADTAVRIVSMADGKLVWQGTVGEGQTAYVGTGAGTFSFLADKKASILVGTPSSCTVVGYWLRDRDGAHRSDHFIGQLPSAGAGATDRVVVWAGERATQLTVTDRTTGQVLHQGRLGAGSRFELGLATLSALHGHVLDFRATGKDILVQVYQDEGFTVPSIAGGGAGREFATWIGGITEGVNDLNLVSYYAEATVSVVDIDTEELVWRGSVGPGSVHTLTLANRYVRIVSDADIAVIVAPYAHYQGVYAEHHFGMGIEGGAIDTDFLLPTTSELWVFSYYADNPVKIEEISTGQVVWSGEMRAGAAMGLTPGHGFYRVRGGKGISVMGGALACGAEYSPAAGLFQVDEALFSAVIEIRAQRVQEAAAKGVTLSRDEIDAPLNDAELRQATDAVRAATGNANYSPAEASQRLDSMVTE